MKHEPTDGSLSDGNMMQWVLLSHTIFRLLGFILHSDLVSKWQWNDSFKLCAALKYYPKQAPENSDLIYMYYFYFFAISTPLQTI